MVELMMYHKHYRHSNMPFNLIMLHAWNVNHYYIHKDYTETYYPFSVFPSDAKQPLCQLNLKFLLFLYCPSSTWLLHILPQSGSLFSSPVKVITLKQVMITIYTKLQVLTPILSHAINVVGWDQYLKIGYNRIKLNRKYYDIPQQFIKFCSKCTKTCVFLTGKNSQENAKILSLNMCLFSQFSLQNLRVLKRALSFPLSL